MYIWRQDSVLKFSENTCMHQKYDLYDQLKENGKWLQFKAIKVKLKHICILDNYSKLLWAYRCKRTWAEDNMKFACCTVYA